MGGSNKLANSKKYFIINIICECIGLTIFACGLYFSFILEYSFPPELLSWFMKIFGIMFFPLVFLQKNKKELIESNLYIFLFIKIYNNIFMTLFLWVFLADILAISRRGFD